MPKNKWDWQSALLVVALVQIASARLVVSDWVPKLEVTQTLSLYAVILGLAIGYSSLRRRTSIWMAVAYGIVLIPAHLLTTLTFFEKTDVYDEDMRYLIFRLYDSIVLFFQNQPIYDTLFFVMLTSVGFWILAVYVGYRFTRHNDFLDVIFGPGVVMLIIQIYDPWVPLRAWGMAIYIFVSLALLGRMYFLQNREGWKKKHVFLSSDTEWEFSRSVISSAAVIVLIAWSLPGILTSFKPAAEKWRNFIQPFNDRFSNAVTALDSPYGTKTSSDFYANDLKLGSSTPLSDLPVFYVQVENEEEADVVRYYWRGRIYDTYQDGQWSSTKSVHQDFDPDTDVLFPPESSKRTEVNIQVTMNFPEQELIYAPSELTWFNRDGKLVVSPAGEGDHEVLAMLSSPSLLAGDAYEVHTMIANPTINDLRAASSEYPEWVKERYLQVPEELEPQLRELAEELTESYVTPYDKVQAVTLFLRREIRYESSISEMPPSGTDPLLWVLFDYKKGFCMYYASAEVLLLRTLGIPARMAVGFAQGEFDETRDHYVVTRKNSHAWPEVYFPGIGWVEFEPTGNQPPLDRPRDPLDNAENDGANPQLGPLAQLEEGQDTTGGFDPTANDDEQIATSSQNQVRWTVVLYISLSVILMVAAYYLYRTQAITVRFPIFLAARYEKNGSQPPYWLSNWANWAKLLPIERSFQSINVSLRWLGSKQPNYKTPVERAETLAKLVPDLGGPIQHLLTEYQNALFTPRQANLATARKAGFSILFKTLQIRLFHYKEILKKRYN